MIRVGVAAQSTIVRAGISALLASEFAIVGSAEPDALLGEIDRWQADVIVLEIDGSDEEIAMLLPLFEQVEQKVEQRLEQPSSQMIVLIDEAEPETVRELLRLGVRCILPQAIGSGEIAAAIEAVAVGLIVLHPDFSEDLQPVLSEIPAALPMPATTVPLTPREMEVLQMVAEGISNKTIARRLHLSEHTVKFHISSIFSKLQVSSRTEAVIAGTRLGLVLL